MVQAEQQLHRSLKSSRRPGFSCCNKPLVLWTASSVLFLVVLAWVVVLSVLIRTDSNARQHDDGVVSSPFTRGGEVEAKPVFGTRVMLHINNSDEPMVEFVFSPDLPFAHSKGIALLLHACTHNALKFFSPNEHCLECVGLAEELRIARVVLERGYLPVAVTCRDQQSGCWSDRDISRLERVVEWLRKQVVTNSTRTRPRIVAIGASSGGHMAANLAVEGLADAALVMVMGLRPRLQEKLSQTSKIIPLYLAPMPRDRHICKRVEENYQALKDKAILDESSCVPLPLTVDYLVSRVVGLTRGDASTIVSALKQAHHLREDDSMFERDPTQSNWREILLMVDHSLASESTPNLLWGHLVLTRGQSPLAKALHRAWAFHEYCSEAVHPALDYFERSLTLNASLHASRAA